MTDSITSAPPLVPSDDHGTLSASSFEKKLEGPKSTIQIADEVVALENALVQNQLVNENHKAESLKIMALAEALRQTQREGIPENLKMYLDPHSPANAQIAEPEKAGKVQAKTGFVLEDPLDAIRSGEERDAAQRLQLQKEVRGEMITDRYSSSSPDEKRAQALLETNGSAIDLRQVLTDLREDNGKGSAGVADTVEQDLSRRRKLEGQQGVDVDASQLMTPNAVPVNSALLSARQAQKSGQEFAK